jgi:RNA polymerase sigma-70 factor (ECF subfamily)
MTIAAVDLDARLQALLDEGRRAWPNVVVEPSLLRRHLAQSVRDAGDAPEVLDGLCLSDLYLAFACARGIPEAVSALDRNFMSAVPAHIARIDRSPDFVDEVLQRLRERVLVGDPPRIATYSGKGPLGGWLRVAAIRVAVDLRRQAKSSPAVLSSTSTGPVDDPERDAIRSQYRAQVEAAFRAALSRLSEADRQLLRLHYVQHLNFEKIARLHSVDRSTISRRVATAQRLVLSETKREVARLLPSITKASRDSLLVALRSQIHFNFETALGQRLGS